MKSISNTVLVLLFSFSSLSYGNDLSQLDDKAKAEQVSENAHNQQRVTLTAQQKATLTKKRDQLANQLAEIEQKNQQLSDEFAVNEEALAEQKKSLLLATGSLGELFGVVRQSAKDVQTSYQESFLSLQGQVYDQTLSQVINTDTLPTLDLLQNLWHAMDYKVNSSNHLTLVTLPYVQGDSKVVPEQVIRLGDIALVSSAGYLKWDFAKQQATNYLTMPTGTATLEQLHGSQEKSSPLSSVVLDPSRGLLLEQYADQPTLIQRIDQAGIVGKIILLILVIGLIIAVIRGFALFKTQQQISSQLKRADQPGNNPLGRILQVYSKEKKQTVESLELRLVEAVLDEQDGLERGLSMLKLFAALAPMLGLLGTVTGMIETFQVITQFGNGDPKVMAGGISMALTTTVLGLVAAMPLLLAHNILSNRADVIRSTLEKQGISLVAERAEIESNAQNERCANYQVTA